MRCQPQPMGIFFAILFAVCCAQASADTATQSGIAGQTYNTIEWTDLIPPEVLDVLMNPPDYVTEIEDGSAEDQIGNQMKSAIAAATDDAYQQALSSTEVNQSFDGTLVRLPGFVVPLEFDDAQVVTQFFLVPYFGACLHMPPPPPNQIVLVDFPQGMQMKALYDPVWILGEMSTDLRETDLATAAYSMSMVGMEPYTE